MIGFGNAAEVLCDSESGIPAILIDPIGDIEDRDHDKLHIVHTGIASDLMDTVTLAKCLIPILETLREDVHSNEKLLEELIEMALIKTEQLITTQTERVLIFFTSRLRKQFVMSVQVHR